jgi:hypothetical protein
MEWYLGTGEPPKDPRSPLHPSIRLVLRHPSMGVVFVAPYASFMLWFLPDPVTETVSWGI